MHTAFLRITAFFGALSVALGAFAAHGLSKQLTEKSLGIFETAVKYQFYHVFALALAAILYREYDQKLCTWAGRLFIAGILIFSGSLYCLSVLPGMKWLGAITPFGGTTFIAGWICLFLAASKGKKQLS